jgi:hypothetical protein
MNQGQSGQGSSQDDLLLDYMMEMGMLAPEEERIARQRGLVDQLRARPTPEGRQAGRVYVAANPLEHLAGVAGQGLASWKENKADAASEVLQGKKVKGIADIRNRRSLGAQTPSTQTAFDPYDPAQGYGYASPL